MSSKLRLNSPEAAEAFQGISAILSTPAETAEDAIEQARRIVSLWSSANLDLYDDEIIPFRSINEPLRSFSDAAEEAASRENILVVYKRALRILDDFTKARRSLD